MLWIDFETFNVRDRQLRDVGTYEYSRTCRILLAAYAFDEGPVKLWDATCEEIPSDLKEAVYDPYTQYRAHNSMFDRNVLKEATNWCEEASDPKNWTCSMVDAMLHGFPGKLAQLCKIFKLNDDKAKMKEGEALINKFCKPAPDNHKADVYDKNTHPELWAKFCQYAKNDVEAMREISKRMPKWNNSQAEYVLDQTINDRGFLVDRELVEAGIVAAVEEKENLQKRFWELTEGVVERPSLRGQFKEFLNKKYGIELPDTQAATFTGLLEGGSLHPDVRELFEIAIASNKTSTAKYGKLGPATSPDDRFRGGLQIGGAARTRRWAGRTFQPHNLPSRGIPKHRSIQTYIDALKLGVHTELFAGELMRYGSAAIRGVLIAPKGKKLIVSDLSNIEGRINAWISDEQWKLKAFKDFDTPLLVGNQLVPDEKGGFKRCGPDLYNVTAGGIIGQQPGEVESDNRNIFGKIPELSGGYQGAFGAYQKFCKSYNIKMADYWPNIVASVEPWCVEKAKDNWRSWGKEKVDEDVSANEWVACDTIKVAWRAKNPKIEQCWYDCDNAAKQALRSPGKVLTVGAFLKFQYVKCNGLKYLRVCLPNGNYLVYANPFINKDGDFLYFGKHPDTGVWTALSLYGGKIIENICQSIARDILMQNMISAEAAGYSCVLSVHDEVVCEVPDTDDYSEKELSQILATQLPWTKGLPLAAEGFEAHRYRK